MSDRDDDTADEASARPAAAPARRPEDDAADLGLAVVAEATAMVEGDDEALAQSDQNLRDLAGSMVDRPFTPRQEEVVATLGAMGGSIAAGVGSALAHADDRDPHEVLRGAAESIVRRRNHTPDTPPPPEA